MLSGLTAAISATVAAIKKIYIGSGTAALIISNKDIVDMMKIADSFKESGRRFYQNIIRYSSC